MVDTYYKEKHNPKSVQKNNPKSMSNTKSENKSPKIIINEKTMNEFEKIKEKESLIFKDLMELINNDPKIKKAFYYLLFSDIINNIGENDYDLDIIKIYSWYTKIIQWSKKFS